MGTRSLTKVIESYKDSEGNVNRNTIICMYRQYDGYPSGHGIELAEFLQPFTIVNGMKLGEERKIANGMGCLAAQLVVYFKDGPGNIYLYPIDSVDCGEEYLYEIVHKNETIEITIYDVGYGDTKTKELFSGTPIEFLEFVKEEV